MSVETPDLETIESWSRERLENEYLNAMDRLEKCSKHNKELMENQSFSKRNTQTEESS